MNATGKQGKTKGATSYVMVTLEELNRILKPEAQVMVSRKFSEALHLTSKKITAEYKNYAYLNNQINLANADETAEETAENSLPKETPVEF